jgi:hypothetical protein
MKKGSKNVLKRNFDLLFYSVKRKLKNKFENFTKHEPMMKAEAVEKTLFLLRRDFDMADQNDIVITLVRRLHDRREADLIKLQEKMDMMKEQSEKLKEKVIIN